MKRKSYSPQQSRNLRVVICRRSKRLTFKPIQRDGSLAIFKYQEYVRQRIFQKNVYDWLLLDCLTMMMMTTATNDDITTWFYLFIYDFVRIAHYCCVDILLCSHSQFWILTSMRTDKNHTNGFLATQIMLFERTRSFSLPDYYHLRLLFIFMCLLKCVIHE